MTAPRWLVDTSITKRSRTVVAHRFTPGAVRSNCGQGFRVRGRVLRGATPSDRACGSCALKAKAEIRAVVMSR